MVRRQRSRLTGVVVVVVAALLAIELARRDLIPSVVWTVLVAVVVVYVVFRLIGIRGRR